MKEGTKVEVVAVEAEVEVGIKRRRRRRKVLRQMVRRKKSGRCSAINAALLEGE
jgi:hypothetical protein